MSVLGAAKTWLETSRTLGMGNPSFREAMGWRGRRPVVVAVGGNSFDGMERPTAGNIAALLAAGNNLIITHGNGPQVGRLLLKFPHKTTAECVYLTQIEMGGTLKREIEVMAEVRGLQVRVEVVPTRVVVGEKDPAFNNPTKGIGPFYNLLELQEGGLGDLVKLPELGMYKLRRPDGQEWFIKEVAKGDKPFRRVVSSPKPIQIFSKDLERIVSGMREGKLVVAVGGGGVPVSISLKGEVVNQEAVIDKDLASALLARELKARGLIISAEPKRVALDFGKRNQKDIDYFWLKQMLFYLKRGHFKPGTMGEKIEAGINFLRNGGNLFLVTNPELDWIKWQGTLATRGVDVTGRIWNMARRVGLVSSDLQRWLVV